MRPFLLLSTVSLFMLCIACNDDFTHEKSQTIVNQSDYDILIRIYQSENTNIEMFEDSIEVVSNTEVEISNKIYPHDKLVDLTCAIFQVDSIRYLIENNLTVKKDIMDFRNWVEDTERSGKNRKVQHCRFIINNDDLE